MKRFLATASLLLLVAGLASPLAAAPDYHQAILQGLYPAGGQRGTTVEVTFLAEKGALTDADDIVIDGLPGVTAENVRPADDGRSAKATLHIAADAPPGRRMLRVKGGTTGLTNYRWFIVGALPEHIETEKNNSTDRAEVVELPVVVNGRIAQTLDQDLFRFSARKGQSLVVAVMSHWLDVMGYGRNDAGFADTSLELLDSAGRVVAEAGDTLGYDPLIHYVIPADGEYTARVSGMGYKGFPQLTYRLTIGEVPYPTAIFPAGGRRGESVEVEFSGPNIPPGTTTLVQVGQDNQPVQYVQPPDDLVAMGAGLPFVKSDFREIAPAAEGTSRATAIELGSLPAVVNDRFTKSGQPRWYRLKLKKGESVECDLLGQRHLRSPLDTLLEIQDSKGERMALNDDGEHFSAEVVHEFVPFDSYLSWTAKDAGDYFLKVAEQSGAAGDRAVFRLTVRANEPDFDIYQWPDVLPVWGPGSTSACVVEIHRFGGIKEDVTLSVEGLPEGWTGSTVTAFAADYRAPRKALGQKLFLTITAPEDAAIGEMVEFRIVGRAVTGERSIEKTAVRLTQYLWQEPNRFRPSPVSRAVVARSQGLWLESEVTEITAAAKSKIDIPVRFVTTSGKPPGQVSLSLNRATTHFKCALGAPLKIDASSGAASVPFQLPDGFAAGHTYYIVVADAWSSETRKGLPGPCTRLIRLTVEK